MEETYLTVRDVQKILGFSLTKTYSLVNQLDFPKIKFGHDIRIPQSKFEKFMDKLVYKEYKL